MINATTTWLIVVSFFQDNQSLSAKLMSLFVSLTVTEKEVQQW